MYAVAFTGGITITESGILQLAKQFTENNTTSISEFVYNTYTISTATTTTVEMGRIATAAYVYVEADKPVVVNVTTLAGTIAIPITKDLLIGIAATGITLTTSAATVVKVVVCGA